MNKLSLPNLAKTIQLTVSKHQPEILTGIGIAGLITTTVLAVRATPKALSILDDAVAEKNEYSKEQPRIDDLPKALSVKETVALTWKCYIPAAVTGALSVACLVGASSVNARRNAALAAAYTLSENTLKEYQEKVIETIGEKKEQVVRDAVAKDKIEKDPVSNKEVIVTGNGDVLCYDCVSGRYFESTADKLRKVENTLNRRMRDEMYVSLNDFYSEIGLDPIKVGNDLGWNIDRGEIDISFSAQVADNDQPCLVVDYTIAPQYGFAKLF